MENSMKGLTLSLHKSNDYSFSKSLMIFAKESHVMEPELPESQEENSHEQIGQKSHTFSS